MKLLMENWRKYLTEQEEGEGVLLYHATCSPPEAFASGIDATRSKGFGQGEGFYFFQDKRYALNHAKDHLLAGGDKEEAADCSGGVYIVVSDEPVMPETFDIDYEEYAGGFVEFVVNNREYFEPKKEEYHITRIRDTGFTYLPDPGRPNRRRSLIIGSRNIGRDHAPKISQMVAKLLVENPEMVKRFEQEALPKANAVKYNGEKVIYPLRIEDLEGNVVWSR